MPFAIAQVSPHPWEARTELGLHIEALAGELARRGHRVVIVAPSLSPRTASAARRALREARDDPASLLGDGGESSLFLAGEVLPGSRRGAGLPVDVARSVEELLALVPLDFVHVHEPFAPSTPSAALRYSRALNVGSFHAPAERVLSTQVARRFVELFFGRLDARIASYGATAALMNAHFPAEYRVIAPAIESAPSAPRGDQGPLRIAFAAGEERAALRVLLRALRRLGEDVDWRAQIIAPASSSVSLSAALRARVEFVADDLPAAAAIAQSDVTVLASAGAVPAPGLALAAIGAGSVPVASRIEVYEDVLGEGERGLFFEPGDVDTLAAQLARLASDRALLGRLAEAAEPYRAAHTLSSVAAAHEEVYESLAARRRKQPQRPARGGNLIDVDLHMHTDHSPDCATPVEVLLATAREQGFGAIAITDHNEISGALDALAKAEGIKVIVGEEVKTATQGEVIGLFLSERIPRGMSLEETVAEIRRQGGLVYVPHPFDRMHAVPGYEHLLAILDDIDAIEVFNPRVAIGSFNEEAARFAAKYRLTAAAGSDAHVAAGLGSVRLRMRDFDGPAEFLDSLRDAEIQTRPTSLLYVQALKFLETRATPQGARRARRARRVRRAMRKS
ncbi:MAG TPA: PHP domain-containing protein [Solirubrobacteraceae bacterium]|nr:PHP domain-containing protein [Solirubrobacteraceae bacterium]